MSRRRYAALAAVLSVLVLVLAVALRGSEPRATTLAVSIDDADERTRAELAHLRHERLTWPEDRALFAEAARTAWSFVNQDARTPTGLLTPMGTYSLATVWDIGSMLAALYSARGLGFIDDAEYGRRVEPMLATLTRLPLYGERVFNKAYDIRTGSMATVTPWTGWSTTDLGRLLIWLRIVGSDPRFSRMTDAVVARNDLASVVRSGYLWGEDLDEKGQPRTYQEGHIGYEQYAARGFALWGVQAERALKLTENALPVSVMRQPLYADVRRWDRLMSEPFLLWGLELGWDVPTESFVRRLLLAQAERHRKTGIITMTGEDSIPQPPHFFYYYCLYADGKEFAVDVQDRRAMVEGPRWISAKTAFAFHALMPTAYTQLVVDAVRDARGPAGWASGVFERTGRPTGSMNINTAAVIMTAALVNQRGAPVLAQARPAVER